MQVMLSEPLNKRKKIGRKVKREGTEIADTLIKLKNELDFLYNNLDFITDPVLIDSYIYEIKAVQMKYQFYLNLCKEHNALEKRA